MDKIGEAIQDSMNKLESYLIYVNYIISKGYFDMSYSLQQIYLDAIVLALAFDARDRPEAFIA